MWAIPGQCSTAFSEPEMMNRLGRVPWSWMSSSAAFHRSLRRTARSAGWPAKSLNDPTDSSSAGNVREREIEISAQHSFCRLIDAVSRHIHLLQFVLHQMRFSDAQLLYHMSWCSELFRDRTFDVWSHRDVLLGGLHAQADSESVDDLHVKVLCVLLDKNSCRSLSIR